jgi:WD40 repeat protein/serine/threonine protein kinase
MNDRLKIVQSLLLEALELESAEERAAFLAEACGADVDLREHVETLINAQAAASQFLPDRPSAGAAYAAWAGVANATASPDGQFQLQVTEQVGDWISRYRLLEKLGEGGCGVVYMAEQVEPIRRKIALKVVKLGMDTKRVVARFQAERQALALMDHPNIAKVLDAGTTHAGRPFFVMELVRGVKITRYCDEQEFSTRDRLALFIQVCQAVQHAHQKGIIHRDLKPSNILVTVNDGVPVPKVIDFGIAKATEGPLTDQTLFTAFEQFVGTPAYMSPEQAVMTSQDIDTRSDIYSLGVLLYELLTGKTPFDTKALLASGVDELRRTIREREPVRPSTRLTMDLSETDLRKLGSGSPVEKARLHRSSTTKELIQLLRGDLDCIVMKCLEKDRTRRYETANGLASDLKRHLNGEPVVARPPSRLYRLQKAVRRNKLAFAAGLAVAAALLAGASVSTWQAVRAHRERQQVQRNIVRQYVANGTRLVNQGDLFGSLLWYAEALRLDAGDARREEPHRIRIASVLKQCPKLLSVLSHGKMLYHTDFSPDGSKVLTASDDRTAQLWDATTGKQLHVLPHNDDVYDGSFSPNGQWVVTSSKDKTARIWNTQTGELVCTLPHQDTVWRACFSPDSRLVATACQDGNARLWDAITGKTVGTPLGHESRVAQVTFSPDGTLLATVSEAGFASIWEISSGRRCFRCPSPEGMFFAVSFSPDSRRFLTCDGPRVHVWDRNTFEELPLPPLALTGDITEASFSPDGTVIVAGGDGFTAQAWDAASGWSLFPKTAKHAGRVLGARISPDDRRLVTASEDGTAQMWSIVTGEAIGPPLKHILHVKYVRFNADGRRLVGNSCDQAARVWDMATGDLPGPGRPIFTNECRLISPDSHYVLMQGHSNNVCIVDTQSGQTRASLPHSSGIVYASFSPDGRTVITACSEDNAVSSMRNDIFLWDTLTGRRKSTVAMAHAFRLLYAAFSSDSTRLLTCGFDFTARVWDTHTGQPMTPPLWHRQRVSWGAFSPNGQEVVTASWDKTVRVWDASTGAPRTPPLEHKAVVVGAFWSSDAKRLYTLSADNDLQVWDLADGEPLTPPRKIRGADLGYFPASTPLVTQPEDLPRDNRPVADLVLLSQMLAVGRIDAGGNLVPLQLDELTRAWGLLHTKYPEQFEATSPEIVAWHQHEAEECVSEGNLNAARFHLVHALEVSPGNPTVERELNVLGSSLSSLSNSTATAMNRPLRIPNRDPRTDDRQVDLSPYYNLALRMDKTWSDLSEGLDTFGGVRFDVRGLIHLNGQAGKQEGQNYPQRVNDIHVSRKCRLLHFLHAVEWGDDAGDGKAVGTYVLHYADGQVVELPIVVGRDLRDWWLSDGLAKPTESGGASPVWFGFYRAPGVNGAFGASICLWKSTRENPRPNVELASIDFVSAMSAASPFLVALTVE